MNCNRILCSSEELRGAYFCPSYIEDTVLSSIYSLDSILPVLSHLWSIFITFECIFTFVVHFYYICGLYDFVVNYCICGFKAM